MSAKINETNNDLSSSPTQDLSEHSKHKFINKYDLKLSKRPNRLARNKVAVCYKSKSLRRDKKDFNLTGLQVSPEVCTKCHEYVDPNSKLLSYLKLSYSQKERFKNSKPSTIQNDFVPKFPCRI